MKDINENLSMSYDDPQEASINQTDRPTLAIGLPRVSTRE